MRKGRFFDFEHPLSANSLNLDELWGLLQEDGVEVAADHMWRFGLTQWDEHGGGLGQEANEDGYELAIFSFSSVISMYVRCGIRRQPGGACFLGPGF